MMKTTLYLPEEDYRQLKAIARRQNRPAAAVIRDALASYTRRHGKQPARPESLGSGRSGRDDLSERAEDLLSRMGRE